MDTTEDVDFCDGMFFARSDGELVFLFRGFVYDFAGSLFGSYYLLLP